METEGILVQSIYYGKIGRKDTERLMERYGREGSFLLRDSETVQGAYCLCVRLFLNRSQSDTRKTPFVHTYRLVYSSDGWCVQLVSGERLECFRSLERLIESYRGVAFDVNIVPLCYPLDKTQLRDNNQVQEHLYMEV